MHDFGSALGLMLAIEGLAMATFTEPMRKRMAEVSRLEARRLRWMGVLAAALGVGLVWAVRMLSACAEVAARARTAVDVPPARIYASASALDMTCRAPTPSRPRAAVRRIRRREAPPPRQSPHPPAHSHA